MKNPPLKKVGRLELAEALKLLALVRADGLEAIEQGTNSRKQQLRERLTAGAYALRAALEEVDKWAVP